MASSSDPTESLLELRNVSCYMEKGSNVFSDICFTVNEGSSPPKGDGYSSSSRSALKVILWLLLNNQATFSFYKARVEQASQLC